MKYQITYTGVLVVKTQGKMNAGDFIAMAKDLLQHPKCVPDGSVIFDHTSLDFSDVSVADLEGIRAFHTANEERIGSGKSAIVVKSGLSSEWHKLWSQGQKIKTGNKVRVFEEMDYAANWLGKGTCK
jgi:hypothetical protein